MNFVECEMGHFYAFTTVLLFDFSLFISLCKTYSFGSVPVCD